MSEKYPDYVEKDKIISNQVKNKEFKFRFSLKIPLINEGQKKMIILMMNPSKADEIDSDVTVNRVLEFAHNNNYNEVMVLNISPIHESISSEVNQVRSLAINAITQEVYDKYFEENFEEVKEIICSSKESDLYLATGNPVPNEGTSYLEKIYNEVLKDKEVFAFKSVRPDVTENQKLTTKNFTFHPSRQGVGFLSISNRFQMKIRGYSDREILAPNGWADRPKS